MIINDCFVRHPTSIAYGSFYRKSFVEKYEAGAVLICEAFARRMSVLRFAVETIHPWWHATVVITNGSVGTHFINISTFFKIENAAKTTIAAKQCISSSYRYIEL
jgi:hypothetical protein